MEWNESVVQLVPASLLFLPKRKRRAEGAHASKSTSFTSGNTTEMGRLLAQTCDLCEVVRILCTFPEQS